MKKDLFLLWGLVDLDGELDEETTPALISVCSSLSEAQAMAAIICTNISGWLEDDDEYWESRFGGAEWGNIIDSDDHAVLFQIMKVTQNAPIDFKNYFVGAALAGLVYCLKRDREFPDENEEANILAHYGLHKHSE